MKRIVFFPNVCYLVIWSQSHEINGHDMGKKSGRVLTRAGANRYSRFFVSVKFRFLVPDVISPFFFCRAPFNSLLNPLQPHYQFDWGWVFGEDLILLGGGFSSSSFECLNTHLSKTARMAALLAVDVAAPSVRDIEIASGGSKHKWFRECWWKCTHEDRCWSSFAWDFAVSTLSSVFSLSTWDRKKFACLFQMGFKVELKCSWRWI